MEETMMEAEGSVNRFFPDAFPPSQSQQHDGVKAEVNDGLDDPDKKWVQASEVTSTSLYIRRNLSLYQQLTKGPLRVLELPTSPVDKKNLQDRWTAFPSPLPMPPIGSPNEYEYHQEEMPIRMKSLPSFGFKIGKLAESAVTGRKKRSRGRSSSNTSRSKTIAVGGGRGSTVSVVVAPNKRQRRRRVPAGSPKVARKSKKGGNKGGQSSISNWVIQHDLGAGGSTSNSSVGIEATGSTSLQEQQRAILITAYSVMEEENARNRKALHDILNILNRELIQKIEGYKMLMAMSQDLLHSENAMDMIQLLTEVVVEDGGPSEKMETSVVESEKQETRDQSTMTDSETAIDAPSDDVGLGYQHADEVGGGEGPQNMQYFDDLFTQEHTNDTGALSQFVSASNAYYQYQNTGIVDEDPMFQILDELDIPISQDIQVQSVQS